MSVKLFRYVGDCRSHGERLARKAARK